eukprot:Lankesteria_metandrocarpae@DN10769_c0_g1_i1.p1
MGDPHYVLGEDLCGYISQSTFREKFGTPRQPGLVASSEATLQFYPQKYPSQAELDEWSRTGFVVLVFLFHLNKVKHKYSPATSSKRVARDENEKQFLGKKMKITPPKFDGRKLGCFGARNPIRPNPLGISVVQFRGYDHGAASIVVRGVDVIDGTPVVNCLDYRDLYPDFIRTSSYGESAEDVRGCGAWPCTVDDKEAVQHNLLTFKFPNWVTGGLLIGGHMGPQRTNDCILNSTPTAIKASESDLRGSSSSYAAGPISAHSDADLVSLPVTRGGQNDVTARQKHLRVHFSFASFWDIGRIRCTGSCVEAVCHSKIALVDRVVESLRLDPRSRRSVTKHPGGTFFVNIDDYEVVYTHYCGHDVQVLRIMSNESGLRHLLSVHGRPRSSRRLCKMTQILFPRPSRLADDGCAV